MRFIHLLLLLLSFTTVAEQVKVATVEPEILHDTRRDWLVLDVRSQEEFNNGHVAGALLAPHNQIEEALPRLTQYKEQKIALYCRSGRRAAIAAKTLSAHGFKNLYLIEGDMPGWREAGLPVAQ